jgi:hypothetical protein
MSANSWDRFIHRVKTPFLSNPNWGLADQIIEEIRLENDHERALCSVLDRFGKKDYDLRIHLDSFNTLTYSLPRIFANLVDHLCHLPKKAHIGYVGHNGELVRMIGEYMAERGFLGKIHSAELPLDSITLFIIDFGFDENSSLGKAVKERYRFGKDLLKQVMQTFIELTQRRGVKFVGIHVLHTDFDIVFSRHLSSHSNGHSTGICYGYPPLKKKRFTLISTVQYFVVRYGYNHSDRIRSLLMRTRWAKKLFNGPLTSSIDSVKNL